MSEATVNEQVQKKRSNVTLPLGCCAYGSYSFGQSMYSFCIPYICTAFGISKAAAGLAASATLAGGALGGILSGILCDKYGRRKILITLLSFFAVCLACCGFTQNITQLAILRFFCGFCASGMAIPVQTMISESAPPEKRARYMSIQQSMYGVGSAVAALVIGPLVSALGWRRMFNVTILILAIAIWAYFKLPESEIFLERKRANVAADKRYVPFVVLFQNGMWKTTMLFFFITGLYNLQYMIVSTWFPTYLATPVAEGGAGISLTTSSLYMFGSYLCSFIGYMTAGRLSDKLGRRKTLWLYFIMGGLMPPLEVWAARVSIPLYFVFNLGFGFFNVAGAACIYPIATETFPTQMRSTALGFIIQLPMLIISFFVSALVVWFNNDLGLMISCAGLISIITVALVFFVKEHRGINLNEVTGNT